MKKIYFMGLTAAFALSVNAQTIIKLNRSSLKGEIKNSSSAKAASTNAIAASISCPTQYTAGTSNSLKLTLNLSNTDNEYGDSLAITLPAGFTVTSAFPNDSIGVSEAPTTTLSGCPTTASGTKEPFRGIFGQNVIWGNNDNCYGGMPSGTNAGSTMTITLNVTVGASVTGPKTVNFFVSGDGFGGAAAADFTGSFIINPAGTIIVDIKTNIVGVLTSTATQAGTTNCSLTTHTVASQIKNLGTNTATNIPVNYMVNGTPSTLGTYPGPLAAGDSALVIFPVTFNFSAQNVYVVKAWSAMAGDINKANDTASFTMANSVPVALTSTTYTNGFESRYDQRSVNYDWVGSGIPFSYLTSNSHSGTTALFLTINMALGAPAGTYESFINLPCMNVTAGDIYKITFWKKAVTSGTMVVNGQTAVFTGTAQNAAAMTTVLKPYSPLTPVANSTVASTWTKDSVNFVSTATETRYFAIGGKGIIATSADQINVRIDDIKITKLTTVGIKTISSTEAISIFPNPTSGILNINAIEVNSSIEVLNVIGEKVYTSSLVRGNNSVDLADLANGTYLVKINSNNQVITKKVVLTK